MSLQQNTLFVQMLLYMYNIQLSLLFICFISHGYLPIAFIKTAIAPTIKKKSGNSSDKANYRPIAEGTACSKIFES